MLDSLGGYIVKDARALVELELPPITQVTNPVEFFFGSSLENEGWNKSTLQ